MIIFSVHDTHLPEDEFLFGNQQTRNVNFLRFNKLDSTKKSESYVTEPGTTSVGKYYDT